MLLKVSLSLILFSVCLNEVHSLYWDPVEDISLGTVQPIQIGQNIGIFSHPPPSSKSQESVTRKRKKASSFSFNFCETPEVMDLGACV